MDSEGRPRRRNDLANTGRKLSDISSYNLLYADIEKVAHEIYFQIESSHSI